MDEERSLGLLARRTFPFVEAIGQNKTAFVFKAAAKGWFFCQRFTARIDKPAANLRIFGPHGYQTPYKKICRKFVIVRDGKDRLRWCDIKARCEFFGKTIIAECVLSFSRINCQCKSSTHGYSSFCLVGRVK